MTRTALITGITGQIPDGMLVRVSNINSNHEPSYRMHEDFIKAMTSAISPEAGQRAVGG